MEMGDSECVPVISTKPRAIVFVRSHFISELNSPAHIQKKKEKKKKKKKKRKRGTGLQAKYTSLR